MSLRDMFVEIGMDIDEGPLKSLNDEINDIVRAFRSLSLGDVENEFREASLAADDLSGELMEAARAADDFSDELDRSESHAIGLTISSAALALAVSGLNSTILIATAKFALFGAAGVAALSAIATAAAPVLLSVLGLSASLVVAGLGVASFGVVAVSSLSDIFDAASEVDKIQQKIDSATSVKERIKAEKELSTLYDNMSVAQLGALKELQNYKAFWADFAQQFDTPVFTAFGEGLKLVQGILRGLEPTITNVANVLVNVLEGLNKSLESGGFKGFFEWLEVNAAGALSNFVTIGGNLMNGFFSIMQSFSPVGTSMEEGLIRLTGKFKEWADGLGSSTSFQDFISYAKTNGPILVDLFTGIWETGKNIVTSLAPLGTEILDSLSSFFTKVGEGKETFNELGDAALNIATWIKDNWNPLKDTFIVLGSALGALYVQLQLLAFVNTITGLWKAYQATTFATTLAQHGLNAAMKANPIGLIITATTLLIGAGVFLYQNWDTIKLKAGELWSKTKEVFGNIYNWGMEKIQPVTNFFKSLGDKFSDFRNAISNFKLPGWVTSIGSTLSNAASKVGGLFNGSHATGLGRVPYDGYVAELHKDEAVLTAEQSNALRSSGILSGDGVSPSLSLGQDYKPLEGSPSSSTTTTSNRNSTIQASITIQVNDSSSPKDTAKSIKDEIEDWFSGLNDIFPVVMEG